MSVKGFQIDASILDLNDVAEGSPPLTIGDGLIYTGAGFATTPIPTSVGLDGLPDVTLTPTVGSPPSTFQRYELLTFDETSGQWVNEAAPDAGVMSLSTGTFTGGELQFGSGSPTAVTTITITAGEGIIVDNYTDPVHPTYKHVSWPQFTDVAITSLATADRTFFAYGGGSPHLVQQTTPFTDAQHRDYIHFGAAGHANRTYVVAVRSHAHAAFDGLARLGDLATSIGSFNVTGNVYSAHAGSPAMAISKSAGSSYHLGINFHTSRKTPDITTDATDTALSFNYSYRAGGSDYVLTDATSTIDADNYDGAAGSPAGLEAVPSNQWQTQIIKHFPGGGGHRIEYGQTLYGTRAAAIAAIPDVNHVHNPAFAEGITRGYLVIQEGETDITNASFIEAGKFGAGGTAGDGVSSIFTSAFESSLLSITANTNHSAAHGLGVRPSGMQAFLRCTTAELGYAIGDEVEFLNGSGGSPATTTYKGIYADTTNIAWFAGPSLVVTNLNNGTPANVTLANWRIILRAYA